MRRKWQLRDKKFSILVLAIFIAVFAAIGAYKLIFGNAATTAANLWVVNSGAGSCSRSSTAVAFNSATSCSSFDTAYQAANKGDLVLVTCASGATSCSYPSQTFLPNHAKAISPGDCKWSETFHDGATARDQSGCIQFAPNSGVNPSLGGLAVGVPYVYANGFNLTGSINVGWNSGIGGICTSYNSQQIILRNMTVNTAILNVNAASYLYVIGGTYSGPNNASSNIEPCYNSSSDATHVDHIAIDGATFKDYLQTDPAAHDECIHWQDTDQGVVTNSKFLNCAQQDISFHPCNRNFCRLNHMNVSNNVFDGACSNQSSPCGSVSGGGLVLGCNPQELLANFNIVNNSMSLVDEMLESDTYFDTDCAAGSGHIVVTGNMFGGTPFTSECSNFLNRQGFIMTSNLYGQSIQCGGSTNMINVASSSVYVNPTPTTYDYAQKSTSPSRSFVAGACPTSTDLLGNVRPATGCDAGAYQFTGGGNPPPPPPPKLGDCNSDGKVDVTDLSILLTNFNTNYSQCDFNSDSTVNIFDLSILLTNFGT